MLYIMQIGMILWSYLATFWTCPGLVPPGWTPFPDEEVRPVSGTLHTKRSATPLAAGLGYFAIMPCGRGIVMAMHGRIKHLG